MKLQLQALIASVFTVTSGYADLVDIPDTAIANGSFTTLVQALTAAELVTTLRGEGPFTVFAPTDDAFGALPDGVLDCLLEDDNKQQLTDVLKYHVVSGTKAMSGDLSDGQKIATVQGDKVTVDLSDGVKINTATVSTPNVEATNGVIHVIDSVLVPDGIACAAAPLVDIPATAIANGNFKTLVTALTKAELVTTLEGAGPFTVFAPTDDAFDALPDGVLECLLKDDNKQQLTDVLKYHVVSGAKAMSTDLSDGQKFKTVQGDKVTVDLSDGVKINTATVSTADVEATNGVIHVIDSVLVPDGIACATDDDDDSASSMRMMSAALPAVGAVLYTML